MYIRRNSWSRRLIVLALSLSIGLVGFSLLFGREAPAKTELVLWDTFMGENSAPVKWIIKEFERKNPDAQIKRTEWDPNSMRKVIKLALTKEDAPDLFYYDSGPPFLGVLVHAGLLENLTDAYASRGWNEKVVQWGKDTLTYEGKVYGIPHEVEFLTIWYNKDMFKSMGLGVPKTWDEYININNKMVEEGVVPWPFGNAKGNWWSHQEAQLFEAVAGGPSVLKALKGQIPWNSPEFVETIKVAVEFYEKKYFNNDFNALDAPDCVFMFYNGQAGMFPCGTWMVGEFAVARKSGDMPFDYGYFNLPPYKPGVDATAGGNLGSCLAVSTSSKNKDKAFSFMDEWISDEAARQWLRAGFLPAIKLKENIIQEASQDPIMAQVLVDTENLHMGSLNVHLPSNVNDYIFQNCAEVLQGKITPQEFMDTFNYFYSEWLKSLK